MSDDETNTKDPSGELASAEAPAEGAPTGDDAEESAAPATLGAAQYVFAAFLVAGLSVAYISGRVLAAIWDSLAAWPAAVRVVPQLLLYGEDERPSLTIFAGALVGIAFTVHLFRSPGVRRWSDDVAAELAKVAWPSRETVTNGIIVVVVASALATVYVGLLDRLWGFVTQLVYGA